MHVLLIYCNVLKLVTRYDPDPTICPFLCLKEYIHRTQKLGGTETMLFISYVKPYKPVSRDTISRWTKATLKLCGIDTTVFSAHSTRAAFGNKLLPVRSFLISPVLLRVVSEILTIQTHQLCRSHKYANTPSTIKNRSAMRTCV